MKFIIRKITRKRYLKKEFLSALFSDVITIELGRIQESIPGIIYFEMKYSLIPVKESKALFSLAEVIKINEFDLRIYRNQRNYVLENNEKGLLQEKDDCHYFKTECDLISYEEYKKRLEDFIDFYYEQ